MSDEPAAGGQVIGGGCGGRRWQHSVQVAGPPVGGVLLLPAVARVGAAQASNRSPLDGVSARYVLIWFTGDLPPDGGRHRATVSELTVLGAAEAPDQP